METIDNWLPGLFVALMTIALVAMWIGYELYRIREHMDRHNRKTRRTKTRLRLSPQLFDQETN